MTDLIQSGPFTGRRKNGYQVIYADPAWTFTTRSPKGDGRSPSRHYDCMTLDEIKALPVKDLAAKNCVLLMWVIDTHLPKAFEVIEAWGFNYKTVGFYWEKTNKDDTDFVGMGYWTRANPEQNLLAVMAEDEHQCLLSTMGAPKRVSKRVRRLIRSPRREHSRKPDRIYADIEALVEGPYIELFARTSAPGWEAWGNETTKFKNPFAHLLGDDEPIAARADYMELL